MQVYADNAATAKMRAAALETYIKTAQEFYANASSLHSAGQRAKELLTECRENVARAIGCTAREIIFTSGGSEADNQAIMSAAFSSKRKGKTKIISTAIEHHAVLHALNKLEREGFEIVLLPVGESGIVSVKDAEKAITPDTCLVSVMLANNEIGTLQPVKEIGAICKERGVLFHTDAVQAVGHIPVDAKELNADYLALSAHKFGGPKGVGALYARTGVPLSPLIEGGAQERGKRAGTEDLPAIAAMSAALSDAVKGMDDATKKTLALRERLIEGLSKIPHSSLNGDRKNRLAGNVSFCFEGVEGEALLLYLDDLGVCASSGSACTSGSLDPSHVLLAIGRKHEVAHGSLRLTLNENNTQEEVDYLIKAVTEVVEKVRSFSPVWRDLQSGKREFIFK
ncbi:MAG: cysteine desulfurase [Clostridiales bacterium]|nr:cysteine desulfurase [Clostridiales bacterium]